MGAAAEAVAAVPVLLVVTRGVNKIRYSSGLSNIKFLFVIANEAIA